MSMILRRDIIACRTPPACEPKRYVVSLNDVPYKATKLKKTNAHNHRLNGSSSPVLTATSLSYGKTKNSTPHRIKTPDLIEMKFGTVDYVGELTPHAKFHVNPSKGASRQMGEIYAKIFISIYLFFFNSPTCLLYTSPSPRDRTRSRMPSSA